MCACIFGEMYGQSQRYRDKKIVENYRSINVTRQFLLTQRFMFNQQHTHTSHSLTKEMSVRYMYLRFQEKGKKEKKKLLDKTIKMHSSPFLSEIRCNVVFYS